MIKVNVMYQNNLIKNISIKGHADYADYGKDIVCASVSTMTTTTINNILVLDKDAIIYDTKSGMLNITINNDNEIAIKLINNMINMLKELEISYPKNIEIGGLK